MRPLESHWRREFDLAEWWNRFRWMKLVGYAKRVANEQAHQPASEALFTCGHGNLTMNLYGGTYVKV
jgi:hypothetical protein